MKILIVSFTDDNFGDNLIRICFENLLKVVLKNHNITDYEINKMPLKRVDPILVKNSDYIFFAGGGLFGLSYLNFFEFIDEITKIADENNIPVIFSSLGINNMDATEEAEQVLKDILKRKCIKAISVRENLELFEKYAQGCDFKIEEACDPAVWTKYVYGMLNNTTENIIGINVVRGGLFKDNKKNWGLTNEMDYLYNLKCLLDKKKLKYKFYTNGSFLDNNTLRFFAKKYDIPNNQVEYIHTTRELVETISKFKAIAAFRMHTSIVAYSFNIPSVALAWNDKIPFFYQKINQPERALDFENWDSDIVFKNLCTSLKDKDPKEKEYQEYLMTVYKYLYNVVSTFILKNDEQAVDNIFDFKTITKLLIKQSPTINEDEDDLRFKLNKGEKKYLGNFIKLRDQDSKISKFEKEISTLKSMYDVLDVEKDVLIGEIDELKTKNDESIDKIDELNALNSIQKKELDRLNKLLIIRFLRRVKRLFSHKKR